jgi:hypothetical protein
MQLVVYLSHVVVKDLVHAKINNRLYDSPISADELMDFLKKLKIETVNNPLFSADPRAGNLSENNLTLNPGASVYSFQQSNFSEYSKDDIQN